MIQAGHRRRRSARLAALAALAIIATIAVAGCGSGHPAAKKAGPGGPAVRFSKAFRYGIVDQTLKFGTLPPSNPWEVPVTVTLTSPSGQVTQIDGFYYGGGIFKFRFSPPEPGRWQWQAALTDGTVNRTLAGSFQTQPQRTPGFVRSSPYNGELWSFEDGSPYYPLGLQTCLIVNRRYGPPLTFTLDGGFRPNGGAVAPGQRQILAGAGGRRVNLDTYIRTYAAAGFNLYRWTVDNCSFGLYDSLSAGGNVYNKAGGRYGDQLVRTLHKYGMRVYMTFFGFNPPRNNDPATMAAALRYVSYVVARYGAYVDYWELMNEATRSQAWYAQVTSYLRKIDPYHHPISTSYPPTNLSQFDINSPHWYEHENELTSDLDTHLRFKQWKSLGKPVIVGEQGNSVQNWDPRSAVRMRLRIWSAFFSQGSIIFWNQVAFRDATNPGAADIWLGPTERRYASVLQRFTSGFDQRAVIAVPQINHANVVRGYELRGPRGLALYLTNYTDHTGTTRGVSVVIDSPFPGKATWTNPATGQVLAKLKVPSGSQRLNVPAFNTDIALKILP